MSQPTKNLYLLDAFALIFRAYFAFIKNPRRTSQGLDTSAVFGFTLSLMELLEKEKPSHIAVVFDTSAPTQRHIEFPQYKANRDETPEAIRLAVPLIHRILKAYGIPIIAMDGFEADDVIGTLCKKAEQKGYTTYMVTPDKDFGQLVSNNILIYKPSRGGNPVEIMGEKEVCEKFGIERVEQVIDMLGMMGDAVDNIPGLPGVGEKTAQKLLAEYGSLENVLANAENIKGKLGEKIRDNAELGLLSKKLATIILDVPVELDEENLILSPIDEKAIEEIFQELEFRTLLRKVLQKPEDMPIAKAASTTAHSGQASLFGEEEMAIVESSFRTLENYEHLYQCIETEEEIKHFVGLLLKQESVCWDTETDNLDERQAQLVGIAFSWKAGRAFYIPFPEKYEEQKERLQLLLPFFESESILKVGQNLKYDIGVLLNYGVEVKGPMFDTMLAHYLLQPDMRHNFDALSETYLHHKTVHIEELIGKKGSKQGSMRNVAIEKVVEYAGEDADLTQQLQVLFNAELDQYELRSVFEEIEIPLVPVLSRMEREGIALDTQGLAKLSLQMQTELIELEENITEAAGVAFNIASPKQLGEILFDHLKIGGNKVKKTKTGQYATSEDILQTLVELHPIVPMILEFRQLQKLKNTYVDSLPTLVDEKTLRIHTSYNQAVASTGRLSSNNPNLQNIPIRNERGKAIRAAFIPRDEEHILFSADYSQIELRLIAELSGDEAMTAAFLANQDIHAATAAKLFNIPLEDVTREQRGNAKTVNFGIIYGVSAFGLSQQTNLSRSEAADMINQYFITYPGIKKYMDNQVAFAREHGFVKTLFGRRRILRDILSRNQTVRGHAERNAVNAPIQGTAADVIKKAMIAIDAKLRQENYRSKMLLQVHDELVFDCHISEKEKLKQMVTHEMSKAVKTKIPLIVDSGFGANWLEAH